LRWGIKRPVMPTPTGVHLIEHPVLGHLLTVARDRSTSSSRFRELLDTIGALLGYEATRDLKLEPHAVRTPLEPYDGVALAGPITLVPILRAGLGLSNAMLRLLPRARMGHIGLFRNEDSLRPVEYYQKLPPGIANGPVLLVDPMLATGGSAIAAAELLKQRGCADIRFICLLAAPEGIDALRTAHDDIPIYTAAIDRQLNEHGFILPGLGDAGDRVFGTTD